VGSGSAWATVVLSGDATLASTGAMTLANSGVTAAAYGDGNHVPAITVDAKGRITAASSVAVAFPDDPYNWWWLAEPTQTAATTIVHMPTSRALSSTTNNPTLTA